MQLKAPHEIDVFRNFALAAALPIEEGSVESANPPHPDIRCAMRSGEVCLFELAEVLWEEPDSKEGGLAGLAHGLAISERASKRKAELITAGRLQEADYIQTAGSFGYPPLASLLQVLEKKSAKRYDTDGHTSSLLLYYERQSPVEPFDLLAKTFCELIYNLVSSTPFSDVWLYHHEMAYCFPVTAAVASGQAIPLSAFFAPESQRAVIGRLIKRERTLQVTLDPTYSEAFHRVRATAVQGSI